MSDLKIFCTNPECKSENVIFSKKRGGYFCEDCDQEIIVEKTVDQLNIFISYGRDQYTEFAEKVKNDLKARGHNVWFDKERLKEGADWEDYIEEGLKMVSDNPSVGRFVYIVTPHSARKPDGYCLNEIARILTKNVGIVPVMLVYCELPLSICRIQWLDAQDCVNNYKSANYDKTIQRLIEALEEDKLDYEGVQSNLLKILNPIDFGSDIYYNLRDFTGRKWLIDIIDNWLADENGSKVFVLQGGPGVGKTAISAYLIDKKKEIAGYHLCNSQNTKMNNPVDLVKSIAYQISTQIKEYQDRLALINIDLETDAITLFNQIIAQPLYRISNPEGKIFILIDALDEAKSSSNINEIADLISTAFRKTPDWLRMIVTTRPEPGVIELLQKYNPYLLDASSDENINDIKDYLNWKLQHHSQGIRERAINSIIQKSEGNFLYAKEICDEIEDPGNKMIDIEHPDKFPYGMGDLYLRSFHRKFGGCDYKNEIEPIISVIIAALEPVPIKYLCSLLSMKESFLNTTFLIKAGSFFPVIDGKIRPFHKSLIDWIIDRQSSNIFFISKIDADKAMGELSDELLNELIVTPNEITESTSYCIQFALIHLYKAGMKKELQENFLKIINLEKEIYEQFIAGVDNLIDWVIENKKSEEETLLKKMLPSIINDLNIHNKLRFRDILDKKAERYKKIGHSDWALVLFEFVIATNNELIRLDPNSIDFRRESSVSFNNVGNIYFNMGDGKKALKFFEKSLSVQEALVAMEPDRSDFRLNLSVDLYNMGNTYRRMGDEKKACEFVEKSLFVSEALVDLEPDRSDFRLNLSKSLYKVVFFYRSIGDEKKACELVEKSLTVSEALVDLEPDRSDFRLNLSVDLYNMGNIYRRMRDEKKADECFEKELSVSEALVGLEPDRSDFRLNLSKSLCNMGNIYRSMGDEKKAREYFEKSLSISEALVDLEPDRSDFRLNLSVSFYDVGSSYRRMGDAKKALECFEKSLSVREALVDLYPNSLNFRLRLSESLCTVGDIYKGLGDEKKAIECFEKSLSIQEALLAIEPDRTDLKRELSKSFNKVGNIYRSMGDEKKARELVEKSLFVSEALVDLEPDRTDFKRELSKSFYNVGIFYFSMGDEKKARELVEKSLSVREALVAMEPDRTDFRQELSVSFNNMGTFYKGLGDENKALECFEKELSVREALVAMEPDRRDLKRELSVSFNNMGIIYHRMGNEKKSLWCFEKSLSVSQAVVDLEPDRTDFKWELSESVKNMGNIYKDLGDEKKALECFEKFLSVSEALVALYPNSLNFRLRLSESLCKVGDIYKGLGDEKKALECFEKSLTNQEALVDLEPDVRFIRLDLSESLCKVGDIYKGLGDENKALECFEKSLSVQEILVAMEPDRTNFRLRLSESLCKVGDIYKGLGDEKKALECFEKSLTNQEALVDLEPYQIDFSLDYASIYWKIYLICPAPDKLHWLNKSKVILERWINIGAINQQLTQLWGMVNDAIGKIEKTQI